MKTYIFSLKKASLYTLFGLSSILLASCGSYQNSSYYDNDGIYGGTTVSRIENTQRPEQNNAYAGYFKSLQDDPQSNEVFTDVDNYNNYDENQSPDDHYADWGNNYARTNINIYPNNNWGMNYGFGYGFPYSNWGYSGWGYSNFGWGSPYSYGYYGWNSPFYGVGWNNPYYGYGWNSYGYNSFNNNNYNNSYNRVRSTSNSSRGNYSINSRYNSGTSARSSQSNTTSRRSYNSSTNTAPVFSRNSSSNSTSRSYDSSNNTRRESSTPTRTYTPSTSRESTPTRTYTPSSSNDTYTRPSSSSSSSSGGSYGGSSSGSSSSSRRGR